MQSMADAAYEILDKSSEPMAFKDLWASVAKSLGMNEATARSRVSKFYNSLSMDGRFLQKDNAWTLKSHVRYEDSFNPDDLINDDEEEPDEDEQDEEINDEDDDDEELEVVDDLNEEDENDY